MLSESSQFPSFAPHFSMDSRRPYKKSGIYTTRGDRGCTSLLGSEGVSKNSPMIHALGEIDELNAILGLIRAEMQKNRKTGIFSEVPLESFPVAEKITEKAVFIERIQRELFLLSADLLKLHENPSKTGSITEEMVYRIEKEIDAEDADLPPLRDFVIPGENCVSARFHVARTVCRRAERRVVEALNSGIERNPLPLKYLNRLGDLLFVFARCFAQIPDCRSNSVSGTRK